MTSFGQCEDSECGLGAPVSTDEGRAINTIYNVDLSCLLPNIIAEIAGVVEPLSEGLGSITRSPLTSIKKSWEALSEQPVILQSGIVVDFSQESCDDSIILVLEDGGLQ